MRKPLVLVAVAAGLALGVSACNPVTPYAALVNGTTVSRSALNLEMQAINGNPLDKQSLTQQGLQITGSGPGTYTAAFASQVLTRQIEFVVVDEELARRHLQVTATDLDAARSDVEISGQFPSGSFALFPSDYRQVVIRRQAALTVLEAALAGADVSPPALAAYAAAHQAEMQSICADRILVSTLTAAAQVETDLKAGHSFASEAQAKSQDTNSSSSGGQLGCNPGLAYAQLSPAVAQAVETVPLGQVSAPVLGSDGISIFVVTARSPLSTQQADFYIRSLLTSPAQNLLGPLVESLLQHSDVTVDNRFGSWTRTGLNGGPGVVAPVAPKVRSDGGG